MMSTLRWSLLILGVLLIGAREWWEWRRPRQGSLERRARASTTPDGFEAARLREAAEPAHLRESVASPGPRETPAGTGLGEPPLELPEIHAREPIAGWHPPRVDVPDEPPELQPIAAPVPEDAAGSGDEPQHTFIVEPIEEPIMEDEPIEAEVEARAPDALAKEDSTVEQPPLEEPPPEGALMQGPLVPLVQDPLMEDALAGEEQRPAESAAWVQAAPAERRLSQPRDVLPELPASDPPVVEWPPDEERRVVALRLVATHSERFGGRSLRQALAAEGFVLGRFAIFHKPDEEHRAVLSAASLSRPGTFDPETMDSQHYGGLSLFAVLPGPKAPPDAFEELVTTARSLNERLCGVLQDEGGTPLTPARIASLRQRLSAGAAS